MPDNVTLNAMSGGAVVATDEVTDGVLGTVQVQMFKLMDATLGSTNKAVVTAGGALRVDGSLATQPVSGTLAISNLPVTVSTNSGNRDASTLRVTLATDQVALTTAIPVSTTGLSAAVDGSGSTNATPSTSTAVFGSTPVNGFEFTNVGSADIWINDNAAAAINTAGSIRVTPGGQYTTPVGYKPIGDLRTISATASVPYTARRW